MTFPYVPSGGILQQAIDQFKRALPAKIDAATLKKLGVAPSNEGYVISTLKFLGIVNPENEKTELGVELFSTHGDEAFSEALSAIVRDKYAALFDIRGEDAWSLDRDALISFFRQTDKTSAVVGARQSVTFLALASMAGKRDPANQSAAAGRTKSKNPPKKATNNAKPAEQETVLPVDGKKGNAVSSDVALTVRIEINLPANGSQATYDNIFKSIKENLLKQNA